MKAEVALMEERGWNGLDAGWMWVGAGLGPELLS